MEKDAAAVIASVVEMAVVEIALTLTPEVQTGKLNKIHKLIALTELF